MWIWLLMALLMVVWGCVAVAACRIAGQATRMEDAERELDARARELLKDIEIDLEPAPLKETKDYTAM
jgi:hypothetical protein